jgi:hypothetical protein
VKTIVLEGPDGSGKTTLAAALERLGYARAHRGVPKPGLTPEGMMWTYLAPLLPARGSDGLRVFDRLHLGETVYGPVMRGGSQLTELGAALIDSYVEAIDGQVVVCLPPWRFVLANWLRTKKDQYVRTPRQLLRIYQGYQRLLFGAKKNRDYLHFDYTRHGAATVAAALRALSGFPLPADCAGSQRPRFVFVGDRAGRDGPDLPFMSCDGPAGWLHGCLADAGYQWHETAFANALDPGGLPHNLSQLATRFPARPRFVALGAEADRGLNAALIEHHALGHPRDAAGSRGRARYVRALADIRRGTRTR